VALAPTSMLTLVGAILTEATAGATTVIVEDPLTPFELAATWA
jgi:hypothetical protein